MKKNKFATWEQVQKIENGPALSRAGAWVILLNGVIKGTIKAAYPKDGAGRLTVILHEHGFNPQIGHAGGYGYDKLSAAIHGMVFNGIELQDHPHNWERQLSDAGFIVYRIL